MDPPVLESDSASSRITIQMQIHVNPTEDSLELWRWTCFLPAKQSKSYLNVFCFPAALPPLLPRPKPTFLQLLQPHGGPLIKPPNSTPLSKHISFSKTAFQKHRPPDGLWTRRSGDGGRAHA